jgi:predicted DNA-binding transcriptional regulator AlpA
LEPSATVMRAPMTRGNLEHSTAHAALPTGLQDQRDHSHDRDAAQIRNPKDRGQPEPLLTEKELSAWLGVSAPNLQRMRSNGSGPPFIQLSPRRIGYRKCDVEVWLAARTTDRVGALASVVRTPGPVAEVGRDR